MAPVTTSGTWRIGRVCMLCLRSVWSLQRVCSPITCWGSSWSAMPGVMGLNGVDTTVVRCPGSLRQLPAASGSPITLATVRAACSCDVPEVAGVAHQLALHCLPDAWRQHVLPGPLRRPQWFVSSCGKWVRDGRAPHQDALEVRPDGRLGPPALPLPEGGIAWAPACVVPRTERPTLVGARGTSAPLARSRGVLCGGGLLPLGGLGLP